MDENRGELSNLEILYWREHVKEIEQPISLKNNTEVIFVLAGMLEMFSVLVFLVECTAYIRWDKNSNRFYS